MNQANFFKRILSVLLILAMLTGDIIPGLALAVGETADSLVSFTQVDNSEVSAGLTPSGKTEITDEPEYADTDMVRVSIVLSRKSTIEAGYSAMSVTSNQGAIQYRDKLKQEQTNMVYQINKAIKTDLDVVWNLTLAANIISANVQYGEIEAIKKLPGVKEVILENQYLPCKTVESTVAPQMATSGEQIGTGPVWEAGYTGAGMRIAVIDTGIDTDHQSLNAVAFEHALAQIAKEKGMTKEAYIKSLDLLDAKEIASVADKLNVPIDPQKTYVNSKIPFGYNYRDFDYDVTHDNDEEGDHGSHVSGIAAANSWLVSQDGKTFGKALEHVMMQGVAPEAQLLALKVFGKNGSPYDSDFFAAIEDAIVLGADSINLSLGSTAPGRAHHSNEQFEQIMTSLTKSGVVVSISAGNAGSWVENAANGGYLYNTDVSMDTLGQPGAFTNSMCVASVENDGMVGFYFTVDGEVIVYIEEIFNSMQSLTTMAGEQEYIFIDGVGTEADWNALKDVLPGKIAICSRGETNFTEKARLAVEAGAKAVMIYNNVAGIIYLDMTEFYGTAPVVSLTKVQGAIIRDKSTPVYDDDGKLRYLTGKMVISDTIGKGVFSSEYYTMSDFSSWGVTGSLELKPEITAPGGNIFSLEGLNPNGGAYSIKSGTSMAAPQIAGMAALLLQYIEENDLDEKTNMDIRHLAQSLLMSTATPLQSSKDVYYPVIQQGAGLANIHDAINADSFITMAPGSSAGAEDGKVKVELYDDPDREGVYSATFTVHNIHDVEKALELNADFFIQSPFSSEGHMYMDTLTEMIGMDVVWTVNGETVVPAKLEGLDFNGDGKITASDGQRLLDFATGTNKELTNRAKADIDGDGDIDSHDAYLFLRELVSISATLPANGETEITVSFSLTEELKAMLDEVYPNGTYIQGYIFAQTEGEEEGTCHSIPVLGFYGNWTDSSMFETGRWPTYANKEDDRIPYLGVERTNDFKVRYAKDPNYHYSFGGNPVIPDAKYMPERDAMNSNDFFHGIGFAAIRHADQSRVVIRNETTGDVLLNQQTGAVNMAYYLNEVYGWQNSGMMLETNVSLKNASEDDEISVEFTLVPEYYIDANGDVDWEAMGDGATMSTTFVIDNTAPVLKGVSVDQLNNTMTIVASDNQYVAAAGIYNKTGTRQLAATGAKQDIQKGETAEYTFSLDKVNGKKFLVQVFDYAMNVSTYLIEMQIGEEAGISDMIAYDLVQRHWTTFAKDFKYSYKTGTPRLAYSDYYFYAATIAEHYIFASTHDGELYVMPEDDLTDTTFIVNMGTVLYDMAYNKADGEIYAITETNELVTIGNLTGELTRIGKVGISTNTLACDTDGTFYCNELGTGKVYSFTLATMDSPTLLMEDPFLTKEDPINGNMNGTTGNMGMEYDPNTGMLCWNSHCEVLMGSYITMAYYYEINPKTGEFTRYNDFWHEMSCLMVPDETGRNDQWAQPTDKIAGVSINKTSLSVIKGTTAKLTANVQPWTATDRTVTWFSSDESVATVDKDGVVTGIAPGRATITARSTLDPTKFTTCEVSVELLEVTINGTVADADGKSTFYSWNMATENTWKPGKTLPGVMTSATWSTLDNAFYMMDTSEALMVYKVDKDGKVLASAPSEKGIPLWDMAYSETFSTANQEMINSIYYCYLLSPKDPLNLDAVGFDLSNMCSYLVGITTFGSERVSDTEGNEYDTEHLVMLDNDGYIWHFWIYAREGGGYDALYAINKTTLECEFPGDETMEHMFTSLMVGEDGNLYLSTFDGSTNELYHMSYDEVNEQYNAVKIGDMGTDVWPATITSVTVNGGNSANVVHPAPKYTMTSTQISQEQLAAASQNMGKTTEELARDEENIKLAMLSNRLATNAAGTMSDPILLVEGNNTGVAPTTGNDKSCYFAYTAAEDGTAVFSCEGTDWRAQFYINGVLSAGSSTVHNPKYDGNEVSKELVAGDTFMVKVTPYSGYSAVGGEITVNFHFEVAGACEHTNLGAWEYNDTHHWKTCECGEKLLEGTHSYQAGSCTSCGKADPNYVPEPTNPAPTNPEPTNPEPTNPEPTNPEPTNPEPTNPEPTNPEPTNPEPTNPVPGSGNPLYLGKNTLESGKVYTYTATESMGLDLLFENLKGSDGLSIIDYIYGQGKRVNIMVNGTRVARIKDTSHNNETKVTVAKGQTIAIELVSVDGDRYTVDVTLTKGDPTIKLNLGDNNIEKKTAYSFVAPQSGTLYTTIKELWYDSTYCSEASLTSTIVFRINGVVVDKFKNSYEVKAGDEITFNLGLSFGNDPASAVVNLSYEGFYEHPIGSRGNPYTLNYADCPTNTVKIPANTAVWYRLVGFSSSAIVTITGENAYAIVGGSRVDAKDGVVTIPAYSTLQIGNAGGTALSYQVSAYIPEGVKDNPKDLVEGNNSVELGERENYYYDFVAPQTGRVTVSVSGDYWGYQATLYAADGAKITETNMLYKYKGDSSGFNINMTAGQTVVIKLGTMNSAWEQVGGTITVNFHFEADENAAPPTCQHSNAAGTWQSDGSSHWQICDKCNQQFNKGTHTPGAWQSDATHHWKECTTCHKELSKGEHDFENDECNVCGKQDPNSSCDHTYGEWVNGKKTCSKCGNTVTCKHGETDLKGKKDPTCDEEGYTGDITCTICGMITDKGKAIPALGHDFQEGICGTCGAADPDYRPVISKFVTAEKDATNGVITITWDTSKMNLVGLLVNAKYHSMKEDEGSITIGYVSLEGIPAGEPIVMMYYEVVNPADADIAVEHKQLNNDLPGECSHAKLKEPVVENKEEATCVKDGGYDTVVYCAMCNAEISRTHTVVTDGKHSFTHYVSNGDATHEADGTKTAVCDHGCGAKDTVTDVGSKLGPVTITSDVHTVKGDLISKIKAGTTVQQLLANINEAGVRIMNGKNEVAANEKVGTGMIMQLVVNGKVVDEVVIVVTGDINGDGNITITDMLAIKAHMLKKNVLSGAYVQAADTSGDGKASITDFIQVKALILGKSTITPN